MNSSNCAFNYESVSKLKYVSRYAPVARECQGCIPICVLDLQARISGNENSDNLDVTLVRRYVKRWKSFLITISKIYLQNKIMNYNVFVLSNIFVNLINSLSIVFCLWHWPVSIENSHWSYLNDWGKKLINFSNANTYCVTDMNFILCQ